ncbi:hypothetical protein DFR71_3384 [Nocardia alba]|uniref:Uncharacterized protein n=2 Tax=Nocardia alba TaxID=225051 RepID=A0A4R1FU50_9NOCA|nr:hypothetical protein DFR71_3384 [Nocardia alba]
MFGHAADQLPTLPLMTANEPNARYLDDSKVLAAIGEWIATRVEPVSVRLPLELAEAAVAAWNRDETGEVGEETPDQFALRDRAAELALIGLAVSERGRRDGEDVVVDLHAASVAAAIHAAQSPDIGDSAERGPHGLISLGQTEQPVRRSARRRGRASRG